MTTEKKTLQYTNLKSLLKVTKKQQHSSTDFKTVECINNSERQIEQLSQRERIQQLVRKG